MASKYCWGKDVQKALERHRAGTAWVIPVILKPVNWRNTPLGQLQVLPTDAKPVARWDDQDAALEDVVRGIQALLGELQSFCQTGLLPAEEDTLRAEVSKLSEVHSIITYLDFFEKIAAPNPQILTEYFDHRMVTDA